MIIQRLVVFLFLFTVVDTKPIHRSIRNNEYHQRRSLDFIKWQLTDLFHKQLSQNNDHHQIDIGKRAKRSEASLALKPVEGPISIEQVPAMLAARSVKRYPYSPRNDPNIIG